MAKRLTKQRSSPDHLTHPLRLEVAYRAISTLRPHPRNPRTHSKTQLKKLEGSIRQFGMVTPLGVDAAGQIVFGHARFEAAKAASLNEVPTVCLDHLSAAQLKALMIADNRLAELAEWDDQLLGEQLKELSALDLDFDIQLTGFEMAEIDLYIEGMDAPATEDGVEDAATLSEPAGPPVTQRGDLWLCGAHRLLCGDARAPGDYARLLEGERAALVFSDPPYNVPIEGHATGLGAVHHREFAMAAGEMSEAEFTQFLMTVLALLARHSVDGALHYLCMDWRHQLELLSAARSVYSELKNLCVWVKDNAGMGSLYRSQHELVYVFKVGRAPHQNHVELGRHGRWRSNVWQYPGAKTFSRRSEEGNLSALHPTVKPLNLVADALLDASRRGEVVLDVFLGSGTTLIAAERVGRRCFGMDVDPLYIDTAVRRWQRWTGQQARHNETGLIFEEVAAMRGARGHE